MILSVELNIIEMWSIRTMNSKRYCIINEKVLIKSKYKVGEYQIYELGETVYYDITAEKKLR